MAEGEKGWEQRKGFRDFLGLSWNPRDIQKQFENHYFNPILITYRIPETNCKSRGEILSGKRSFYKTSRITSYRLLNICKIGLIPNHHCHQDNNSNRRRVLSGPMCAPSPTPPRAVCICYAYIDWRLVGNIM